MIDQRIPVTNHPHRYRADFIHGFRDNFPRWFMSVWNENSVLASAHSDNGMEWSCQRADSVRVHTGFTKSEAREWLLDQYAVTPSQLELYDAPHNRLERIIRRIEKLERDFGELAQEIPELETSAFLLRRFMANVKKVDVAPCESVA